jgi:hypothetical protein
MEMSPLRLYSTSRSQSGKSRSRPISASRTSCKTSWPLALDQDIKAENNTSLKGG